MGRPCYFLVYSTTERYSTKYVNKIHQTPKEGNNLQRNASRFSGIVCPPMVWIALPAVMCIPKRTSAGEYQRVSLRKSKIISLPRF